ncbi:hypothetical protein [Acanthopleuribacter pedis]|uniref:Uncharacterized protein n=1 Tax=Acanthopleuribacter pedis TaxID=442870 RepID=A0A8J7U372_9BACT|nr:hypothetical protein [Acanthopleuribacter pedis]MBO1318479.1 hypothetical protein [Acanthopleuribacter pedis]
MHPIATQPGSRHLSHRHPARQPTFVPSPPSPVADICPIATQPAADIYPTDPANISRNDTHPGPVQPRR